MKTDRERLEEIFREGLVGKTESAYLADYLISKGVTIPVRCRECKEAERDDESEWYLCHYHGCDYNKGEHFCSYGERKEDDR